MAKFKFELESNFCVGDMNNTPALFEMFAETADLESGNKKTKKYKVTIEEI